MALSTVIIGGRTATALQTNLDAWFAANLSARIYGFDFVARDQIRGQNYEMAVAILYDSAGVTLTSPYTVTLITGKNTTDLQTEAQSLLAANSSYFFAGPFVDFLSQSRRLDPFAALVVQNAQYGGALHNWLATGAGSEPAAISPVYSLANEFVASNRDQISGATLQVINGAATVPGITPTTQVIRFANAADDWVAWRLPSVSFTGNIRVTAEYTMNAGAGTANVVMRAMWVPMSVGYDPTLLANTTVSSQTVSVAGVAVGGQVSTQFDFTAAQHGLTVGDEALLVIQREGTNVADTEPNPTDLLRARVALFA